MATQKPQPLVFSGVGYTRECDEVDINVTLHKDEDGHVVIVSEIAHSGSVGSDVQKIVEALVDIGETGIAYALTDADRAEITAWLTKQPIPA